MKEPIGIFDSGVGGLTVYKEIRKAFPQEDIVYFGDTARVPYGSKSPQTVLNYSIQNARFLIQNHAKIIVVACNTASAVALSHLSNLLPVPVIGVIIPGSQAAVKATRNNKIGIIGTYGTVNSNAYQDEIHSYSSQITVLAKACPLFVPLVEEGWEDHSVTKTIAREYLEEFCRKGFDTLILGCTHYPILKKTLREITSEKITLIDSAEVIAKSLRQYLPKIESVGNGKSWFYVSDNQANFQKIGSHIIGEYLENLQQVKLGESWYKI